jgi:Gas vesicle protein
MTSAGLPTTTGARPVHRQESTNLADILERVLDKGIVIAGDIRINLLDIELLTVKIRLLIASVDKAREMGIDWWEHDPSLSSGQRDLAEENRMLRQRIGALQSARLTGDNTPGLAELERADEPELERADRPRTARPARESEPDG